MDKKISDHTMAVMLAQEVADLKAKLLKVVRGEFAQICSCCGWGNDDQKTWEELQAHVHSCKDHPLYKAEAENTRLPKEIDKLVKQQAEDEGLWFVATTAPEAYLQQELRKLHTLIENRSK